MTEWERCAPWIAAAIEAGPLTHTLEDVRLLVERGEAQFWPFSRSAMVSLIFDEPQAKSLHQWLIGGDLGQVLGEMRETIEAWARAQGCTRLLGAGRRGWERVLKPYGYEVAAVVYARELL